MLMRSRIGQLFVFGFEGTEVTDELRRFLREYHVGGVILFRRNVESVEQVWELTGQIRAASPGTPPAIFVDEEGGPVSRLPAPVLRLPAMRALGATGDEELLATVGETLGAELRALGVHVNLAPVVDVDTNPHNPVIGPRALHRDPELVARYGEIVMRALHRGGVTACPKHFPGHGDTSEDSHDVLPRLDHDRARLDAVELGPWRRAIAAGARMLMTAHVLLPALDPVHPATLSPLLLPGVLRNELGYEGLVVTDDLMMRAVADRYDMFETISLGVAGATDLFLVCHDIERQRTAMEAAVRLAEQDAGARYRMAERAGNVLRWKQAYVRRDGRAADRASLASRFATAERRALEARLRPLMPAGPPEVEA